LCCAPNRPAPSALLSCFSQRPGKMQFRRSGQRDGRRRRVLTDELLAEAGSRGGEDGAAPSSPAVAARGGKASTSGYTEAANMQYRARVTDLIPLRPAACVLLVLSGVCVIAGLLVLHSFVPQWSAVLGGDSLVALDVTGGIAAWFSSLLLVLAALAALVVYTIRRHKADDYRGRYRVWLWASLAALVLSVDVSAGLQALLRGLLVHFAGGAVPGDGRLLSVGLYAVVFGLLGATLAYDMWRSRAVTTAMAVAAVCYTIMAVAGTWPLASLVGLPPAMLTAAVAMGGPLALALSMSLSARHVILDAQGLVPPRPEKARAEEPRRKKRRPSAAAEANADEAVSPRTSGRDRGKSDLEPAENMQSAERDDEQYADDYDDDEVADERPARRRKQKPSRQVRIDAPESDDTAQHRLSKAERKRLRKQKARQREGGF